MPEAVNLGFDLNAEPAVATIDRLGKSSEAAAASADKLAAAGERIARSSDAASQRMAQQAREIAKLNAQMNAIDALSIGKNAAGDRSRYFTFAMETAQMDALKMDAAMTKAAAGVTAVAGASSAGIPAIAGLAATLGEMVIGGAIITGVLAGINAIIGLYRDLTKESREAKEAAEAFQKTDAAFSARAAARQGVREQIPGAALPEIGATKQIDDARKAIVGIREEMQKSGGVIAGFMENLSPRLAQVNARLHELQVGVATNRITADQYAHALHEVERAFPDYAPQIAKAAELTGVYLAATEALRRLNAEQANATAESNALAAAFGGDGLGAARKQLAEAQSRVGALKSGGVTGLDARDAQLETVERATALWKEYVTTKGTATEAALSFSAALAQGNAHAVEAYQVTARTIAADKSVTDGKQALAEAHRKAEQAAREAARQAKADADANQKATDQYFSDIEKNKAAAVTQVGTMKEENAATRDMIAAMREGKAAVDALTITQAGNNAVKRLGIGVTDAMIAATRREAEEAARLAIVRRDVADAQRDAEQKAKQAADEAQRDMEHRAREVRRATVSNIEGILTDISNGRNPLIALAEGFKRAMIHAISEALAQRFLASKFAEMLGIGVEGAARKQSEAGTKMVLAGKDMLEAANRMLGIHGATGGDTVPGDGAEGVDKVVKSRMQRVLDAVVRYAPPAVVGAGVGYGVGQAVYSDSHGSFGNYARGALGGAAAGALAGSAFGPVGTAVGAVAGFIGGIAGVHKASVEAAKATAELRKQLELNIATLRSTVAHDDLGIAIAQANAQRETLRKQIEDAYSGGGANSDTVRERNRQLAEMNALEDRYIAQLKEEAAAKSRYFTEDLDVRALRAQGKDKQAADLALRNQQNRELDEYRRTHDMSDAANVAQYAYLQYVQSLERNTAAVNALTTTMRGQPSGFKTDDINRYIQKYATAMPWPGQIQAPINPFVPPTSPLSPPMLTRTGTAGMSAPITVNVTVNESKTPQLTAQQVTRMVASELDGVKQRAFGSSNSVTRAQALERAPAS